MFEFVALLTGIITSFTLVRICSHQLLMIIYHVPFRLWRPYLALYDGLEGRYTYELLGGKERFGNYEAFHRKYGQTRPHVTERFKKLWNTYVRQIGRNYGLAILASLALFWRVWWVFVAGFALVQVASAIYLRFIRHQDASMVSSVMVSLLLAHSDVVKTTDDFIKRSEKLL